MVSIPFLDILLNRVNVSWSMTKAVFVVQIPEDGRPLVQAVNFVTVLRTTHEGHMVIITPSILGIVSILLANGNCEKDIRTKNVI